MSDYESNDLVDKILASDHNDAREIFNTMLNDRILSELEAKRVEIASTFLPSDERSQSEIVQYKANQIYNEVDPHSGDTVDNYDV